MMDFEDNKPTHASDIESNSDSDDDGPNEDLVISGTRGTVWLVKVPKAVMEAWTKVDKDGEHLATLRVYSE